MSNKNTITNGNATYEVKYAGAWIGKDVSYQRVLFYKYDEAGKLIVKRELFFKCNTGFITPTFNDYESIRRFWSYPNHARLEVKAKMIYDVKEVTI